MNRILAVAVAFNALLGPTGLALAQNAPDPSSYNNGYYSPPGQTAPPSVATPQVAPSSTISTDPHTGGGDGRAYAGGQKTN